MLYFLPPLKRVEIALKNDEKNSIFTSFGTFNQLSLQKAQRDLKYLNEDISTTTNTDLVSPIGNSCIEEILN